MNPVLPGVIVLCDANVLYKSLVRDLLVRLGMSRAIKPRWTDQIHDEWISNLLEKRPHLNPDHLQRTRALMNNAVPESMVKITTNEALELPDPNDRHVLNAAISASASILLTFNLSDFPESALPSTLQVLHPDAFFLFLLTAQPEPTLAALRALRLGLKCPPYTVDELAEALARDEIPKFAAQLSSFRDEI